jgi:hypothetical protein
MSLGALPKLRAPAIFPKHPASLPPRRAIPSRSTKPQLAFKVFDAQARDLLRCSKRPIPMSRAPSFCRSFLFSASCVQRRRAKALRASVSPLHDIKEDTRRSAGCRLSLAPGQNGPKADRFFGAKSHLLNPCHPDRVRTTLSEANGEASGSGRIPRQSRRHAASGNSPHVLRSVAETRGPRDISEAPSQPLPATRHPEPKHKAAASFQALRRAGEGSAPLL